MVIENKKIVAALLLYSASALWVSLLQKCLINSCHSIITFSLTSALKRGNQFAWKLNQSIASGHRVRLRGVIRRHDDEQWLHAVTQLGL